MPSIDAQPPQRKQSTTLGEQFVNDAEAFGTAFVEDSKRVASGIGDLLGFSKSEDRRSACGLPAGADPNNQVPKTALSPRISRTNDNRMRLSLPPGNQLFYKSSTPGNVLGPLRQTNGIVFPYLPVINVTHTANYNLESPAHTNQPYPLYAKSQVEQIMIPGQFTAQNEAEARYVLAVMHFLRVATKMFYGQDELRGTPPPVLRLSGHGEYMFDNLPVLVQSATFVMGDDVDYIPVRTMVGSPNQQQSNTAAQDRSGTTMIPSNMMIQVTLIPAYSRERYVNDFSLTEYAKGNLLSTGRKGGIL